MKQFMIAFMMMFAVSITMMGQASPKKAATTKEKTQAAAVIKDAPADSDSTKTMTQDDINELKSLKSQSDGLKLDGFDIESTHRDNSYIAAIAIIGGLSVPVLIVFFVFWFRNKNKQAQYRLAEKALESGKDIPEGLFNSTNTEVTDVYAKGVKNAFLGLGLGIFLWAITGEFGLGCIGFMIMFMGIGQVVIHYTQKSSNVRKDKTEQKEEEE